jgi:hypothetical protein
MSTSFKGQGTDDIKHHNSQHYRNYPQTFQIEKPNQQVSQSKIVIGNLRPAIINWKSSLQNDRP